MQRILRALLFKAREHLTQAGPGVGPVNDGSPAGIVEHRSFSQRYICSHSCDGYPVMRKVVKLLYFPHEHNTVLQIKQQLQEETDSC